MPATSAIVDQLIDGQGFVLIPNLIDPSDAAQARSRALEVAASPSASTLGRRNEKNGQQRQPRHVEERSNEARHGLAAAEPQEDREGMPGHYGERCQG